MASINAQEGDAFCTPQHFWDDRVEVFTDWDKESLRREMLINGAEMPLCWQTFATYRGWFSYWRNKGVEVNDLLNMTRTWRLRASA